MDELVERVDHQDRVLGVVSRRRATRERWLHRIASTVCRDERGRFLVHRRSEHLLRYPGYYEAVVGGAVDVGESYEQGAARELTEELGVRAHVRLLFTFINRGGLSPHWLGVHEAVFADVVDPDPEEVAWHGWLTEAELRSALQQWRFTPDSHEALSRYLAFRTLPRCGNIRLLTADTLDAKLGISRGRQECDSVATALCARRRNNGGGPIAVLPATNVVSHAESIRAIRACGAADGRDVESEVVARLKGTSTTPNPCPRFILYYAADQSTSRFQCTIDGQSLHRDCSPVYCEGPR